MFYHYWQQVFCPYIDICHKTWTSICSKNVSKYFKTLVKIAAKYPEHGYLAQASLLRMLRRGLVTSVTIIVTVSVRSTASQDDVIQTPLQLLTLHLQLLYCDGQVLDLLLVQDTLLSQLDVVPLQVNHGELQLLVDLHPAVIHVSQGSGLLGQVLKSRNFSGCPERKSLISFLGMHLLNK